VQILTKRESTDGYKNGRFGNHLRQWDTPAQALAECGEYCELPTFMIRYRGKGSQGPAVSAPSVTLQQEWDYLIARGYAAKDLYTGERCPDHKLTFQGEICEYPHVGGYALHWSKWQDIQRRVLAFDGQHKFGPGAKLLCKTFMDADSYDDLNTLLDLYPLHTIEFSCFAVRLGNLRRNTIFWEVRNC
jgi:hypothetical protein